MGLLKTLVIIIFVYYAIKFLSRLFAPILMKKMFSKMQEKAQQHQHHQKRQSTTSTREGETVIDKRPSATNQSNDSVGEYVDFEEID